MREVYFRDRSYGIFYGKINVIKMPTSLFIPLSFHLFIYASICPCISLSIHVSMYLYIHLFKYVPIYLQASICLYVSVTIHILIYISIYLRIYLSVSVILSAYLSINLSTDLSIQLPRSEWSYISTPAYASVTSTERTVTVHTKYRSSLAYKTDIDCRNIGIREADRRPLCPGG